MTRVYALMVNGETVLEVESETPAWMPVKPKANHNWLRYFVASAIRNCFPSDTVKTERLCLN